MKRVLALLLLAAAALPAASPVAAQEDSLPFSLEVIPEGELGLGEPAEKGDRRPVDVDPDAPVTEEERRRARLDTMFERLAKAETERRAARIARNIVQRLTESGSPTIDLLMQRSAQAMEAKNYPLALDYLDGVVRLQPDFAEGWNRRATVHFLAGDYGRSLADIERTLKLEPRHFGALTGLAMILVQVEKKEEALAVMDRALEVHPFLGEVREQRDKIRQELDGARI